MFERFGFYIMVGILILYAKDFERGGLALSPKDAAEIVGTYLAFVYFTPFIGGLIADRYLGFRRSVLIGGLLMAGGYFLIGIRSFFTFYSGLVVLCLGNGLFKPNISAMVGNLYRPGDPRRDAGFNIFYMGINIGATFSALFSAPIRNEYGFNAAFIVAGFGLLVGVIILLLSWRRLEKADVRHKPDPEDVGLAKVLAVIILPAVIFALIGYFIGNRIPFIRDEFGSSTFGFLIGVIPVLVYFSRILVKAKPEEKPGLKALVPIFIAGGTFFMILHLSAGLMTIFTEDYTRRPGGWIPDVAIIKAYKQKAMPSYFVNAAPDVPRPDERVLLKVDKSTMAMFGQKRMKESAYKDILARHPGVKFVSKKQEGYLSKWDIVSVKIFKDKDVRLKKGKGGHGEEELVIDIPPTATPIMEGAFVKKIGDNDYGLILVSEEDLFRKVYQNASSKRLKPGEYLELFNAELVTGLLNPIFVVALTPLVVAFFGWCLRRGREITTARKIFIGMILTTIALGIMALASKLGGDGASKVSVLWLVAYYLVVTTGELCLSPMGLSLVTKLSPKRLVGLMMGGWFLATSIGNKLSGFISGLHPTAGMFLILSLIVLAVALAIMLILPWLDRTLKQYQA